MSVSSGNAPQSLPPCRVLVRSKQKLELFTVAENKTTSAAAADETTPTTTTTATAVNNVRTTLLENCATTLPLCTAPDGSFTLAHVSGVGIVKCDLLFNNNSESKDGKKNTTNTNNKNQPVAFFRDTTAVQMMHLSPSGTYLLSWERWNNAADNIKSPNNLRVWSTETGRLLAAFPQKSVSRESWPYLQWSTDESHAFLLQNASQVRVYTASDIINNNSNRNVNGDSGSNEPRFTEKLQIPCTTLSVQRSSVASAALGAPVGGAQTKYYFTTFSGKTKDKPAVASVYEYNSSAGAANTSAATAAAATNSKFTRIATKSLFQAEECVTRWSPSAATPACLLTLQTAMDATGQSYYGNSQLWLWNNTCNNTTKDATTSGSMLAVPLPQEGPVQDCQWLPDPNKPASFIVIAGNMPAMASQHHGITGAVTFLFGNNVHRNTIAPSPHGRFICLAGFGNLAGGMGFWDVNKKKLIPHCAANVDGKSLRSEAVTMHGWSPDSRLFLTATTAPRMNVDNGVRLYKYTGELVLTGGGGGSDAASFVLPWNNADYQPNMLLEACFVPALAIVYPDRPQSPVPERPTTEHVASGAAATSAAPAVTANSTSSSTARGVYVPPSARNRVGGSGLAERLRKEKEGNVVGATKVVTNKPVVVAAKTATGRVIPGLTVAVAPAGKSKSQLQREKLKQKKEQEATTAPPPPPAAPVEKVTPAADQTDPEKRARKLKKILKQIDDLKLIADLNEDQKAKIVSEASVRAELEQLRL